MAASVIAFSSRRAAATPNPYGWMVEASRCFAIEKKLCGHMAEAVPVKPEPDYGKEMLALLCRIDRRLAKIASA
jgi:hypothetical protein